MGWEGGNEAVTFADFDERACQTMSDIAGERKRSHPAESRKAPTTLFECLSLPLP